MVPHMIGFAQRLGFSPGVVLQIADAIQVSVQVAVRGTEQGIDWEAERAVRVFSEFGTLLANTVHNVRLVERISCVSRWKAGMDIFLLSRNTLISLKIM